ncbi:GIY-YIG nuclease family protein [Dechloromonas agitata]|uniref:GIY-YIG nuclease family protein n=1 Tax=Dechloromonas agitata TaxID=73030 RepID=UPI00237D8B28|nr:GIY-YIG nuclease family protein [Dechloromonas agitata]MDE1545956.1 GIY-YIG nuclease family protein [Dechloromonas agitata]
MASIAKHKSGWRAQLYVGGVRESAVFDEEFEARAWAKRREGELSIIKDAFIKARRFNRSHRIVLDASIAYSADEIIANSRSLEKTCGVYFLVKEERIIYVGKSRDVYKRIGQHEKTKQFDRITVIECSERDVDRLELIYIEKFKPILNVLGKAGKTASSLVDDLIEVAG